MPVLVNGCLECHQAGPARFGVKSATESKPAGAQELTVTRFDQGKYETVVIRGDGVSYRLKGVAHMFAIPHDLAHFLVEKTLRLRLHFFDPEIELQVSGSSILRAD